MRGSHRTTPSTPLFTPFLLVTALKDGIYDGKVLSPQALVSTSEK